MEIILKLSLNTINVLTLRTSERIMDISINNLNYPDYIEFDGVPDIFIDKEETKIKYIPVSDEEINATVLEGKVKCEDLNLSCSIDITKNELTIQVLNFPANYGFKTSKVRMKLLYTNNIVAVAYLDVTYKEPRIIALDVDLSRSDPTTYLGEMTNISYNPELLKIAYTNGWITRKTNKFNLNGFDYDISNTSSDVTSRNFRAGYMSDLEAAAILDVDTIFSGTDIVHFYEFNYFTSLTKIVNCAFKDCESLIAIEVPYVENFGRNVFYNCSNLTTVINHARVPKLGDFVYADGTITDTLYDDKTVIGVVYYKDPDDEYRGMCVSTWQTTASWGLYPGGVTNKIQLTNEDGTYYNYNEVEYNSDGTASNYSGIYNVPNIPDYTGVGTADAKVDKADYLDDSKEDGFAVFTKAAFAQIGYNNDTDISVYDGEIGTLFEGLIPNTYLKGNKIPISLINTLAIIKHRNEMLKHIWYLNLGTKYNPPIPEELEDFNGITTVLSDILFIIDKFSLEYNNGTTNNDYGTYYYPAGSYCYAYQPTSLKTNELLDTRFTYRNWALPTAGDLGRIAFFNIYSGTDSRYNVFKNMKSAGILDKYGADGREVYWTANECLANGNANLHTFHGHFNSYNGLFLGTSSLAKYKNANAYIVSVCQF